MKTIVIIGSREFRNKQLMEDILDSRKWPVDSIIIMSGKCPELDSVDNWAINWAERRGYYTLEVPSRFNVTEYFFERNKIMAHYADAIVAFVPKNKLRSGVKNCISEFRKLGKSNYIIFDEDGSQWDWTWKK